MADLSWPSACAAKEECGTNLSAQVFSHECSWVVARFLNEPAGTNSEASFGPADRQLRPEGPPK